MTKLLKNIGLGVLASGLFFGSVLAVYADDAATKDDNGTAQKGDHGWNKKGCGDMWKKKFGLTDDQSQKLKDLFKKQREDTQALADQVKVDTDTLRLKVDTKASDDDIKALLDTLSADKKQLKAKRETFSDQFKSILTPTQQAKFLLEKRGHWGHGKFGCPGELKGQGGPDGKKGTGVKHKGHGKKKGASTATSTPTDNDASATPASGDTN